MLFHLTVSGRMKKGNFNRNIDCLLVRSAESVKFKSVSLVAGAFVRLFVRASSKCHATQVELRGKPVNIYKEVPK